MKIKEITDSTRRPQQIIDDLKRKTVTPPAWSDLVKEYDARKHPVMTDPFYADKPRPNG